jgi:hypothetical protein
MINTKHRLKIIFLLLFVVSLTSFSFRTPSVSAIEPGCYEERVRVGAVKVSCPSPNDEVRVQNGACLLKRQNSTTFVGVDCSSLENTASTDINNPDTETVGPSGGNNGNIGSMGEGMIDTDCNQQPLTAENCDIIKYLVGGINFLSALAGLAMVASLMIAGYQYMTAQDNSGKIQQAKSRIYLTIGSLLLFIFMYALLNYLVPGGVL